MINLKQDKKSNKGSFTLVLKPVLDDLTVQGVLFLIHFVSSKIYDQG